MKPNDLAPWQCKEATDWLNTFDSWTRMIKLVRKTLENEPRNYPHQIRAAAAFVIMFGREGLWPDDGIEELQSIVELARRQLSVVRQVYALEGRNDKKLMSNMNYKTLLRSLEEEIRILDSRLSDETSVLANESPCTWGQFLGKSSRSPRS